MISGNQNWLQALGQPAKQPMYVLTIPQYGIILASFSASLLQVQGGYGVGLYGIAPYGT
jgi:hypothetical protein